MPTIRVSDVVYVGLGRLTDKAEFPKTLNGVIERLLIEKEAITQEEVTNQEAVSDPANKTRKSVRTLNFSKAETQEWIEKFGPSPRKFRYQRDAMRELFHHFGDNKEKLVRGYAWLEGHGSVERKSNSHSFDAVHYAEALYNDGEKKGWLKS
jgi:hypothetical protein